MSRKLTAGSSLAQYKILDLLGEGGMGAVYEALDESLDRHVAIKTLLSDIAQEPESRKRFFREGKAAAKLRHPHVVEVYGVGIEDEIPYLVMELLQGESLATMLDRDRRLAPERAIEILLPVMSALVIAHQEGVIHRDLKPDNIFLQKTRAKTMVPKLLDFGISKVTGAHNSRITHTSSLMGTPYYMSPEQARGSKEIDASIDQWAMGVMLYESLAGERPITGESVLEILHRIATMPIKPLAVAEPSVPTELAAVVMRALDREPSKRWPSIVALGHALLPFASATTRATWSAAFDPGPGAEQPPPRAELRTDSAEVEAVKAPVPRKTDDAAETVAAPPKPRADAPAAAIVEAETLVPGARTSAEKKAASDGNVTRNLSTPREAEGAQESIATRPSAGATTGPISLPTSDHRGPIALGVGALVILGVALVLALGTGESAARETTDATTEAPTTTLASPSEIETAPEDRVAEPPSVETSRTEAPPSEAPSTDSLDAGAPAVEPTLGDPPTQTPTSERTRRAGSRASQDTSQTSQTGTATSQGSQAAVPSRSPDETTPTPQVGANGSFILQ